jgi:hypothetical protein
MFGAERCDRIVELIDEVLAECGEEQRVFPAENGDWLADFDLDEPSIGLAH